MYTYRKMNRPPRMFNVNILFISDHNFNDMWLYIALISTCRGPIYSYYGLFKSTGQTLVIGLSIV